MFPQFAAIKSKTIVNSNWRELLTSGKNILMISFVEIRSDKRVSASIPSCRVFFPPSLTQGITILIILSSLVEQGK